MKQRVLLTGNDVIDLLHRITTVNTQGMVLNEKTPALILNPQGKILCFFNLTKKDSSSIEVQFEENFLELLDQYTFGEKYQIENLPALSEKEIGESERIQKMIPKMNHEFKISGDTNPLEINLRSAIHDNKGCYPGQEVIEKIISLGSPAKKICLLEGNTDSLNPLPTALLDESTGAEIGTVTSSAPGFALAIIKRTHLKENLAVKTISESGENHFTIKQVS